MSIINIYKGSLTIRNDQREVTGEQILQKRITFAIVEEQHPFRPHEKENRDIPE